MAVLANIPPFTRVWGIAILGLSALVSLQVISPMLLIYHPEFCFVRGQIWRLFTSLCFAGPLDFNLITHLIMSLMRIKSMEERRYSNHLSALVFIFILMAFIVILFSTLFGSASICMAMLKGFEYLAIKLDPEGVVLMFFVIQIPARYYPYVGLALTLLMGGSLKVDLIGMFAGHCVLFLLFLLPLILGRPVLKVPRILETLFDEPPQGPRQPMTWGRGRRIAD